MMLLLFRSCKVLFCFKNHHRAFGVKYFQCMRSHKYFSCSAVANMFPDKYQINHSPQVRGVIELLENFKSKVTWKKKQKIIDIGCGPGDTTYNHLLPLISSDAELLGIDISAPMIHFANAHFKDSRLNFEVMDLIEPKITDKYASYFDSAFSFYCLQWIQDQQAVMKNIYSILKPGGETLFMMIVNASIYPLYDHLAISPKWSIYTEDPNNNMSPYRYVDDPISDIRKLMQDVGFVINDCSLASTFFTFDSNEIFFEWVEGVNPFLKNIPAELLKEYDQECKRTLRNINTCTFNQLTGEVTMSYAALTVFAHKPC